MNEVRKVYVLIFIFVKIIRVVDILYSLGVRFKERTNISGLDTHGPDIHNVSLVITNVTGVDISSR